MPAVSVIIPNYNQSHFVSRAILSALSQSRTPDEIIVVDDGSSDNSREVVARFGDRVRYLRQKNQGLAGARNTGIQASAGELIGLLDADDEWKPEYLEAMISLAGEHPDALVYYCTARCMDVDGQDMPQFVGGPPVEPHALYQRLLRANFIIPSTVLLRRKPIMEAGMFDSTLRSCEDWDLWLRLLPTGKLIGSPKSMVRYRVHGNSLSTRVQGMHDAARQVVEKHFGSDEGTPQRWAPEKRRAYGGLYRYQAITFIQRQNNWEAAVTPFHKAFEADPSLALDLDFFYELALGTQPVGHRDASAVQEFEANATHMGTLLRTMAASRKRAPWRSDVLATAYHALGLVAYNFGDRKLCRGYFLRALFYKPELLFKTRVAGIFMKSFLRKQNVGANKTRADIAL